MSITKAKNLKNNRHLQIEALRDTLARKDDLKELVKTYKKVEGALINLNTNFFWNDKFAEPEKIDEQDAMTREKISTLVNYLPKNKSKILDLGIGQGYLEQNLQKLNIRHDIYGIDISETSINRSKNTFKGKFIVGNILDIDKHYENESFDVIIAIEVIEHILPKDIFSLYKKVHKLLRKNGVFIISTPTNEGLLEKTSNPSAHVREYTIPILKAEFKLAKFQIQELNLLYAFSGFYLIKKTLTKFFPTRWKPNNIQIKAVKV